MSDEEKDNQLEDVNSSKHKNGLSKGIKSLNYEKEIKNLESELTGARDTIERLKRSSQAIRSDADTYKEMISRIQRENAIEKEKLKEQQERYTNEARKELQDKVTTYVTDAGKKLEEREETLSKWSLGWGITGAVFILSGILTLLFYTEDLASIIGTGKELTWPQLIYISFRGIIVTSLLLALSRYAFVFSKQFSDGAKEHEYRINAINFGRLYLEARGADADWADMKDAFQNWGVSSDVTIAPKNNIDKSMTTEDKD